ncbi:MAG: Maf family protein [Omnitrophica WOR_2 bacterium]
MVEQTQFILASSSPRRRELLALAGWKFNIIPAQVDETPLPYEDSRRYVLRMAESKALCVAGQAPENNLVIGADTIVVDKPVGDQFAPGSGQEILGKPADAHEAFQMLLRLRGHTHQVITAVAIVAVNDREVIGDLCTTDVTMREYTNEEIAAYVASGDPFDKAGGYAIQHEGFHPVESIRGCYANVVGLPLCTVRRLLGKFNIEPQTDLVEACQADLDFQCEVYQQIVDKKI